MTHNIEGYNRNKFYFSQLINQYSPLLICLQEHWLPNHDAVTKLYNDFKKYKFLTTSSDMSTPIEELLVHQGLTWQGTAIGCHASIDAFVTTVTIVLDRFCGIQFNKENQDIHILAYTVYLPTSGKDVYFLEILCLLSHDLNQYHRPNSLILLGMDSNESEKSSKHRS